jgi:hypothetical protein
MSIKRFARIHALNKKVIKVIMATQEIVNSLSDNDLWVASSVSDTKKLADINDIYDVDNNNFKSTKPFASWTFDNTSWSWQSPITMPAQSSNEVYEWDEDTTSWVETTGET